MSQADPAAPQVFSSGFRPRLVVWGTYDTGKPRVRILLRGLRENGVELIECHRNLWEGIADKSQLSDWKSKLRVGLRWLGAYPKLIYNYLRIDQHDAVLVSYMGQVDMLVLWLFAKLRRKPIIWDAFLSLYNTVVEDRRLVRRHHPLAFLLFAFEWLACRAADTVVLDTAIHGRYFVDRFHIRDTKVHRVFVGVEPENFYPAIGSSPSGRERRPFRVLFYGQFIPLHGIETVVQAAKLSEGDGTHWRLIGTGQEARRIRSLIGELSLSNLDWERWVDYEDLLNHIHSVDVCLGIFGATEKAKRVIPNKVYQIIASGKPLITADSVAIRELLQPGPNLVLIPAADPVALRRAVLEVRDSRRTTDSIAYPELRERIKPSMVVRPLTTLIARLSHSRSDSAIA
jgi:glycosyltransferase involved in cell wall biosynthesis